MNPVAIGGYSRSSRFSRPAAKSGLLRAPLIGRDLVRGRVDPGRTASVRGRGPWPQDRIVTVLVDVPARAAGVPDRASQGRAQPGIEAIRNLLADLNPLPIGTFQGVERRDDMAHPNLDGVDHRASATAGVWPVQQEEVREAGNTHAEVGARLASPRLRQRTAALAEDLHRSHEAMS